MLWIVDHSSPYETNQFAQGERTLARAATQILNVRFFGALAK